MVECSAEQKCWEHWQGWHARVTHRDLNLAFAYIQLSILTGNVSRTREACDLYNSLEQRQWCEMTRKPFLFKIPEALVKPAPVTLSTLMDVL